MNRKLRRAAARKDAHKHNGWRPSRNWTETGSRRGNVPSLFATAVRCQQSGRHAEAVAFYNRIVSHNPNLAEAHCNRGIALVHIGRYADAELAYNRAIALQPDLPEAYNNLGELLRSRGRYDEAARALARAVVLNPRYAEALGNLGNTLKDQGKFCEAETVYRSAVALVPHMALAHNNLGAILCDLGRWGEAEQSLRRALELSPDFLEAHLNLGNALSEQGRPREAETICRHAIELDPDNAAAHFNLGSVLAKLEKLVAAETAYQRAIALKPDLAEAHYNLGVTLKLLGRLAEARAAVERAVQLAPHKTIYLHSLSELKHFAPGDSHLAVMEGLLTNIAAFPTQQQISLHFALAKAYDDLGRHEDAFHQLVAGNTLQRRTIAYDEATTLADIERIGEIFSPVLMQKLQRSGERSQVPVFVVGMPRSGSTLIEQILASHPQVYGGGELPMFTAALADIGKSCGVSSPDAMAHLTGQELQRLGARYLADITALAPAAARIVDKTLSHFLYVGLIHLALPQARIIHAVRDPVATCLSCFSKVFVNGVHYSYDLAELGRLYRRYRALMDHWHRVLPPGSILDVHYEDVVDDVEGQARRMIAYCGLEWNERCLAFHKTERPVLTASAIQVRQPLYRGALDRTQNYRRHLAPLLAELRSEEADDVSDFAELTAAIGVSAEDLSGRGSSRHSSINACPVGSSMLQPHSSP